mgnify:CR=1 FL=1
MNAKLSKKEMAEQDPVGYIRRMFLQVGAFESENQDDTENKLITILQNFGLTKEQLLDVDELIGDIIDASEEKGFRHGYSIATNIMAKTMAQ